MNIVKVFGEVVFVGEADPDNTRRFEFHAKFNELVVNAVEHNAVVVIHDRIDEGPFVPDQVGALVQREPVKFSFLHVE